MEQRFANPVGPKSTGAHLPQPGLARLASEGPLRGPLALSEMNGPNLSCSSATSWGGSWVSGREGESMRISTAHVVVCSMMNMCIYRFACQTHKRWCSGMGTVYTCVRQTKRLRRAVYVISPQSLRKHTQAHMNTVPWVW